MGRLSLLAILFTVCVVCLANTVNAEGSDGGQPPVDESKDIRGGGGQTTAVMVSVIVVVLGIVVLVLVFYVICYFCGNLCTKKSEEIYGDIEMGPKGQMSPIEDNEDIPVSEDAALLSNYTGGDVKKDDPPEEYDEYTLNEKGEKERAKPVEVDDNSKPPKLYPSVNISEPPPSEDKKPLYPPLEGGPLVTTATIEKGKDTPPPGSDKPPPVLSLDEPDNCTRTKEPMVSSPSSAVLSPVPLFEPAIVYTAPVARSSPVGEEKPRTPEESDRKPTAVPNKHREEPNLVETDSENVSEDESVEKPQAVSEPVIEEEPSPLTERDPVEPKRETVQPLTRAPYPTEPVVEDPPPEEESSPEKTIIVPVIKPNDKHKNTNIDEKQPIEDNAQLHPEDNIEPASVEKPAAIEKKEEPENYPSFPVVIKPGQGVDEPHHDKAPEEEEVTEEDEEEKAPPATTPMYSSNKPNITPAAPVEYKNTPVNKSPTADKPVEDDTLPDTPIIILPPTSEHTKPKSDLPAEAAPAARETDEEADDDSDIADDDPERNPSEPDEGRPEPALVICPPAPTDWEADETPVSPDCATLPIRSPNTTENEIPVLHSPSDRKEREPESSSPDSVSLQSEDGIILNPSEEVPDDHSMAFGIGMSVPLADMDDDISDEETDGEDEVDLPAPATDPVDLQTPVKSPPTSISHPKVLGYENPQSSDSSMSHSPTERTELTSEDDQPKELKTEGTPRTFNHKEREKSSPEESESDTSSGSPLPPDETGSRDSGFMSLPRGSVPLKGHPSPPDTPVSKGTPNSNVLSPEESEHASKLADQIIEDVKLEIQNGKA